MDEIFGQDIKLDENMQAMVAANGELLLTEFVETGCQDIRIRLFTRLETLFYDVEFGSLIHDWIYEENTEHNRNRFIVEIEKRVDGDPRVTTGSVECNILSWNEKGITAQVTFKFIEYDQPFNLVVSYDNPKAELVIKDVNTY